MNDDFEFDEADAASAMSLAPAQSAAYLAGLNPVQANAVNMLDGPVLILAGAGTGKTRVLTTRLAHLLMSRGGPPHAVHPHNILAVTFTNKAAREMRDRVGQLTGRPVEGWWLGTFHALAARLLRRHAGCVGLESNFTILDTDDQTRLLKQLMQAGQIDTKKWPANQLNGVIQRWKDKGLTPERVTESPEFANGQALELYKQYQARLRVLNACDFGDLLLHNLRIFAEHPDVLKKYQGWFRYILVDEYQDTNVAQYLWLRALAMGHRNICVVGDEDQSIYSWRGAEIANILKFEKDFPGAAVVRLEQNYRSTRHILSAASGVIAHNTDRLGKQLWTEEGGGDKVQVRGVWDGEAEAALVGEELERLIRSNQDLSEAAILVRAGFQTREFEERLITLAIPYKVIGGPRFYERQEIRDAVAYLRLIASPADSLALERIINVPKRGLGASTLRVLNDVSRAGQIPLMQACRQLVETDELRAKARGTIRDLLADFDRWRAMLDGISHVDLAQTVLDESGYTAMWQASKEPDAPGRLENLKELVGALEAFDSLTGFLEHVSLVMENEAADEAAKVTIMTLHAAKGLEFDHVFLPGWEEGVFPHQRAMDESGVKGLEEERRLAYVGLTRAKKRAMVLYAANRRIWNQWQSALPSRFVDEIPAEHKDTKTETGFPAGAGGAYDVWGGGSWGAHSPKSRSGPKVIDAVSWESAEPAPGGGKYKVGTRVMHKKFGEGTVRETDGNKLCIDFDDAGVKKVVESFIFPVS